MIDGFVELVMTVCMLVMFTTAIWATMFFPFFYLWLIPTFAVSIWAYVKKKGWEIPLITFAANIAFSWFVSMFFILNARW